MARAASAVEECEAQSGAADGVGRGLGDCVASTAAAASQVQQVDLPPQARRQSSDRDGPRVGGVHLGDRDGGRKAGVEASALSRRTSTPPRWSTMTSDPGQHGKQNPRSTFAVTNPRCLVREAAADA